MKKDEAEYLKQPRWYENEKRKVRNFKANVGVYRYMPSRSLPLLHTFYIELNFNPLSRFLFSKIFSLSFSSFLLQPSSEVSMLF